jgi:zinc finger SWIM domain-containing protein 3
MVDNNQQLPDYLAAPFPSIEVLENELKNYCFLQGYSLKAHHTVPTVKLIEEGSKLMCKSWKCICNKKNGCKVRINSWYNEDAGGYKITTYSLNHNHDPQNYNHKLNKEIPVEVKMLLNSLADCIISLPFEKFYLFIESYCRKNNISLSCSKRVLENYHKSNMKKKKQLSKEGSRVQKLLDKIIEDKANDENFQYDISIKEGKLENIIWMSEWQMKMYFIYGDVVIFDTTFKTNDFLLPLGFFVGVDSHGKSIIFGTVLLASEMTANFSWCFKKFLEYVKYKQMKTIFTDEDPGMDCAIREIFPSSVHRLCWWHLQKHVSQRLHAIFPSNNKMYDVMMSKIRGLAYSYFSIQEWEEQWNFIYGKIDGIFSNYAL